jgi:hypothetical protein
MRWQYNTNHCPFQRKWEERLEFPAKLDFQPICMHTACMGTHIHIRDFEDEYHYLLVAKANAKNMSLTSFLKDELKKIAKSPSAEAFGDMLVNLPRKGNVASWSRENTAQIVREGREERGEHLYRLATRSAKKKP